MYINTVFNHLGTNNPNCKIISVCMSNLQQYAYVLRVHTEQHSSSINLLETWCFSTYFISSSFSTLLYFKCHHLIICLLYFLDYFFLAYFISCGCLISFPCRCNKSLALLMLSSFFIGEPLLNKALIYWMVPWKFSSIMNFMTWIRLLFIGWFHGNSLP